MVQHGLAAAENGTHRGCLFQATAARIFQAKASVMLQILVSSLMHENP
jgi:hypothetical protein